MRKFYETLPSAPAAHPPPLSGEALTAPIRTFESKKAPLKGELAHEVCLRGHFVSPQIFFAYSSTERSAENLPALAMFIRDILCHLS